MQKLCYVYAVLNTAFKLLSAQAGAFHFNEPIIIRTEHVEQIYQFQRICVSCMYMYVVLKLVGNLSTRSTAEQCLRAENTCHY